MEEYWSVPKIPKWIKEEYEQDIPHSTIEYHLHKANSTHGRQIDPLPIKKIKSNRIV
jgi:hypothetical protein